MKQKLSLILVFVLILGVVAPSAFAAGSMMNILPSIASNPDWKYVDVFYDGYAAVEFHDGTRGFINPYGDFSQEKPDEAFDMSGFTTGVEPRLVIAGNEYFFVDFEGRILLQNLEAANIFSGGVASVMRDGVWYIVDANTLMQNVQLYDEAYERVLGNDFLERAGVNREDIASIHFEDSTFGANESAWDASAEGNGRVMAYIANGNELHIASDGGVVADIDLSGLFAGYSNLEAVHFNASFDTSETQYVAGMFEGCGRLSGLNLEQLDLSNVRDLDLIYGGAQQEVQEETPTAAPVTPPPQTASGEGGVLMAEIVEGKPVDAQNVFYTRIPKNDIRRIEFYNNLYAIAGGEVFDVSEAQDGSVLACVEDGVLRIGADGPVYAPANCNYLFSEYQNVESIEFNGCLDTSRAETMSWMFEGCGKLQSLDLSGFETTNVTDMSFMFSGCYRAKHFDLFFLNTANVTDMESMFASCTEVEELNLSGFDTAKVENMKNMFASCRKLRNLILTERFDVSRVGNHEGIFDNCPKVNQSWENIAGGGSAEPAGEGGMLMAWTAENFGDGKMVYTSGTLKEDIVRIEFHSSLDGAGDDAMDVSETRDRSVLAWIEGDVLHIGANGVVRAPADSSMLFMGYSNMQSIEFNGCFDTSGAENMSQMFAKCGALGELNLSFFNTGGVRDMSSMFMGCAALRYLNLSSFNTARVENMGSMFSGCAAIETLDLSSFTTGRLSSMVYMFNGCRSLTELDVSNFDVSSVTNHYEVFAGCEKLNMTWEELAGNTPASSSDAGISSAGLGGAMMSDEPEWNAEGQIVIDEQRVFSTDILKKDVTEIVFHDNFAALGENAFDVSESQDGSVLAWMDGSVLNIAADGPVYAPVDSSCIFLGYQNAQVIRFNGCFDTSRAESMSSMFDCCHELREVDLSGINTSNVRDMTGMFGSCHRLQALDLSAFDTSNVTDMSWMFYDCPDMQALNISSFDTARVEDMSAMFDGCQSLSELDVSSFDTSRVTDMSWMFDGCQSLSELDVSGFDTSCVTDMNSVFSNCAGLSELDVSGFDTSRVTNMCAMFFNCTSLSELDVANFDTSNVTDMSWMFHYCAGLSELDVTNFDTANVTDMSWMFTGCAGLSELDLSSFDVSRVEKYDNIFDGCDQLGYSWESLTGADRGGEIGLLMNEDVDLLSGADYIFGHPEYKRRDIRHIRVVNSLDGFDENDMDVSESKNGSVRAKIEDGVMTIGADGAVRAPENCAWLFSGYPNLEIIELDSSFDTFGVTDMTEMFSNNPRLRGVEVGNFNTSEVTSMANMFSGCKSLEYISVGYFETGNVESMYGMFYDCDSLREVNISNFDLSSAADMSYMFGSCDKLENVYAGDARPGDGCLLYGFFDDYGYMGVTWDDLFGGNEAEAVPDIFLSIGSSGEEVRLVQQCLIDMGYLTGTADGQYGNMTANAVSAYQQVNGYAQTGTVDGALYEEFYNYMNTPLQEDAGEGDAYAPAYLMYEVQEGEITDPQYIFDTGVPKAGITHIEFVNSLSVVTGDVYDVSMNKDGSVLAGIYGTTLKIGANGPVVAPEECFILLAQYPDLVQISFNGCFDTGNVTSMNAMFYNNPMLTTLDEEQLDTSSVEDMNSMFFGCASLPELDVSGFDTSRATKMYAMFYACQSLSELDVTGFDTSNVQDMGYMFSCCTGISELDLSNFRTGNVRSMEAMFDECTGLRSLDLSAFDTSAVVNMEHMFKNCSRMESLNVSSFNTANVTKMCSLFCQCESLRELDVTNFDTSNVTDMAWMFYGCASLGELDLSSFDVSRVEKYNDVFTGCDQLGYSWESLFGKNEESPFGDIYLGVGSSGEEVRLVQQCLIDMGYLTGTADGQYGNMTANAVSAYQRSNGYAETGRVDGLLYEEFYNYLNKPLQEDAGGDANAPADGGTRVLMTGFLNNPERSLSSQLHIAPTEITSIEFVDSLASFDGEFCDLSENGDGSVLARYSDGALVIGAEGGVRAPADCSEMFSICQDLETIRFNGNFDTSGAVNMSGMFDGCGALREADVSGFNTSNVTDMSDMFRICSAMENIDVSGFDTSKVTNMSCMFMWCSAVKTLDVSGFDTSNVTNMSVMFDGCSGLTKLDVSGFNTSKVTNMMAMFSSIMRESGRLTTVDISGFDTSNVTNMSHMFSMNFFLKAVDVSGFDTSKVTSMASMFQNCPRLSKLDVSGFDTSNVTEMQAMFYHNALSAIDVSGFNTSKVTDMSEMFKFTPDLKEIDVSGFDTSSVTSMEEMFSQSSIRKIDLSGFDVSGVRNMKNMFYGCENLTEVVFGEGWNTSNVKNFGSMFAYCEKLSNMDIFQFEFDSAKNVGDMIDGCTKLPYSSEDIQAMVDSGEFAAQKERQEALKNSPFANIDLGVGSSGEEVRLVQQCLIDMGYLTGSADGQYGNMTANAVSAYQRSNGYAETGRVDGLLYEFFYNYKQSREQGPVEYETEISEAVVAVLMPEQIEGDGEGAQYVFNTDIPKDDVYCIEFTDSLSGFSGSAHDVSMAGDGSVLAEIRDGVLTIGANGTVFAPADCASLFAYYPSLHAIRFNGCFDTSMAEDMCFMFDSCPSLAELDLSGFNTENVYTMNGMFQCVESMETFDLSSFDTRNVEDMSWMFNICTNAKEIRLNSFDTSAATEMEHMFAYCCELQELDLSSFDTSNVTNMEEMFLDCYVLENLILSDGFNVSNVSEREGIFDYCEALNLRWEDLPGSSAAAPADAGTRVMRPADVDSEYAFGTDIRKEEVTSIVFADTRHSTTGTIFDVSKDRDESVLAIFTREGAMYIGAEGGVIAPESCRNLFDDFRNLTSISFNGNFDTSATADMSFMFSGCEKLIQADFNTLNTENVFHMAGMFQRTSLEEYDLSAFDTRNVEEMRAMFIGCNDAEYINVSSFDTSKVRHMSSMFDGCTNLSAVELGDGWDTGNVRDFAYMFANCTALTELDIEQFEFYSLETMEGILDNCPNYRYSTELLIVMVASGEIGFGLNDGAAEAVQPTEEESIHLYQGCGDRENVVAIQQKLIEMGYLNDVADGVFGGNTRRAVEAFQQVYGLPVTGEVDTELYHRILEASSAAETTESEASSEMPVRGNYNNAIAFLSPGPEEEPYYREMHEGLLSVAEQMGWSYESIVHGYDAVQQKTIAMVMIASYSVDALFIYPLDGEQLTEVVDLAAECEIPVFALASDIPAGNYEATYIGYDHFHGGSICGEAYAKDHPEGGTIHVLGNVDSAFFEETFVGFESAVADAGVRADISIISSAGISDLESYVNEMMVYRMTTGETIEAAFCCGKKEAEAMVAARDSLGLDFDIYAMGGSPAMKAMVAEGKIKAIAAESPLTIGGAAGEYYAHWTFGGDLDTAYYVDYILIDAGNLDEYYSGGDNWQ